MTGLPGYTGYVPGKISENVHGHTFQRANEYAVAEHQSRLSCVPARSNIPTPAPFGRTTPVCPTAGMDIPGYMGYIPGKYAGNIVGQTHAKGAESACLIKTQQRAEQRQRADAYRRGEAY